MMTLSYNAIALVVKMIARSMALRHRLCSTHVTPPSTRRRVIGWFKRQGFLDAHAAADMLAWENSGFSIDATVRITLLDRDVPSYFQSLEHLLR